MTTFDTQNHWLIDRGDGKPSVNLVVLAFVNPLKLLDGTTDAGDTDGVPDGMDSAVVDYFTSHGVRVMLSRSAGRPTPRTGTRALAQNATLLGQKAAALATSLGVGIEIDYENSTSPDLAGLQQFVSAYRAVHPYDATGADPAARLTIDLAAGDRYLISLDQYATAQLAEHRRPGARLRQRDGAQQAAVGQRRRRPTGSEHLAGEPQYAPPIGPLAPAKLTGFAVHRRQKPGAARVRRLRRLAAGLDQRLAAVRRARRGRATSGLLGYMFWAAGSPSTRGQSTFPPNSLPGRRRHRRHRRWACRSRCRRCGRADLPA